MYVFDQGYTCDCLLALTKVDPVLRWVTAEFGNSSLTHNTNSGALAIILTFLIANSTPCLSYALNCQSNCKQGKPPHTQVSKCPYTLTHNYLHTPLWKCEAMLRLAVHWLWWEVLLSPLGWHRPPPVASLSVYMHVCLLFFLLLTD